MSTALALATVTADKGGGVLHMITAEMLGPITTAVTSNATAIIPVGIGIMGVMIGVSLIPRLIYKFF